MADYTIPNLAGASEAFNGFAKKLDFPLKIRVVAIFCDFPFFQRHTAHSKRETS